MTHTILIATPDGNFVLIFYACGGRLSHLMVEDAIPAIDQYSHLTIEHHTHLA